MKFPVVSRLPETVAAPVTPKLLESIVLPVTVSAPPKLVAPVVTANPFEAVSNPAEVIVPTPEVEMFPEVVKLSKPVVGNMVEVALFRLM